MTKYLKKFANHADYLSYMGGVPLSPNVSFCEGGDEMCYNALKYHGHAAWPRNKVSNSAF